MDFQYFIIFLHLILKLMLFFSSDRNSFNDNINNDDFNYNDDCNPMNDLISPHKSVSKSPSPKKSFNETPSPKKSVSMSSSPKKSVTSTPTLPRSPFSSTSDDPNYEFERSLAKLTARSESPDLFADDSLPNADEHFEAR